MNSLPPLYLLAGGQSSRFGSNKARALLQNQPLLHHSAQQFAGLSDSVQVVGTKEGQYEDLGFPTIGDKEPSLGPLGGLWTILEQHHPHPSPWFWMTSCDLLGVRKEWLELLLQHRSSGMQVIAFREDFWQPMPALYHISLTPLVERRLREGKTSMQGLLREASTCSLPLPSEWEQEVAQLNTRESLEIYRRKLERKD